MLFATVVVMLVPFTSTVMPSTPTCNSGLSAPKEALACVNVPVSSGARGVTLEETSGDDDDGCGDGDVGFESQPARVNASSAPRNELHRSDLVPGYLMTILLAPERRSIDSAPCRSK